jgi:hypothetical protein
LCLILLASLLDTPVLPFTDQSFSKSSTFLLQTISFRHDLEQLHAGLPGVAQFILAWPCNSRAYAGDGTATRKLSCYSSLRGRISPSSEGAASLEARALTLARPPLHGCNLSWIVTLGCGCRFVAYNARLQWKLHTKLCCGVEHPMSNKLWQWSS